MVMMAYFTCNVLGFVDVAGHVDRWTEAFLPEEMDSVFLTTIASHVTGFVSKKGLTSERVRLQLVVMDRDAVWARREASGRNFVEWEIPAPHL